MNLALIITWAVVTVLLISFEIATVQLVAVWFAAGSFIAFISALFGVPLIPTIIVFIVVSTLLLLCTRPLVKKFLNKKKVTTNADSLIGETCIVTEKIDNISGTGRVLVNGLSWAARASEQEICFEIDSRCKILAIEGVKLIVTVA